MTRALTLILLGVAAAGGAATLALAGSSTVALSLVVRPPIVSGPTLATAVGVVSGAGANETVTVQFKQCGLYPEMFRNATEVKTVSGGGFTAQLNVDANETFRAVAGRDVSNDVLVRKRADVRLSPTRFGKYEISVVARLSFWHRQVVVQRYDPRRRVWVAVKKLRLVDTGAGGGTYIWSSTDSFRLALPSGTVFRAAFTSRQAKPCYLSGTSNTLKT